MALALPTFVNNSAPPIDAAFLNNISRAVEKHDARTLDIRNYGAVLGGDASAAVTAAIADAGTVGGEIYIPAGLWLWNTTPALPKNITGKLHIRGTRGTVIQFNTANRFLDFNRTADFDTFQHLEVSDFIIDVNNQASASSHHVVLGMQIAGSEGSGQRVNVQDLAIRRIKTINVPVSSTNLRRNIWIISRHLAAGEGTQTYLKDILVEDCDFSGGAMGVVVAGTSAGLTCNVFIDNIIVQRIKHDLLTNPTGNFGSSHVHIGSKGFGGTCHVEDIWGFGSRDVGIEINAMQHAYVEGFRIENSNGFYFVHANYNVPPEPGSQQIELDHCYGIWSGGTHTADASSFAAGIVVNGNPLGKVIISDSKMYKSDPSCNSDGTCFKISGEMRGFHVNNFEYVDDHIDCTIAGSNPTIMYLQPANLTPIVFRDVKVVVKGTISTGTFSLFPVIGLYGSSILDWDNVDIQMQGFNTGGSGLRGVNLGQVAGTVVDSGVIRRLKVAIDTSAASNGVRVYGVGTLTINKNLKFVDCDFSALTGTEVAFVTANEQKDKVFFEHVRWISHPKNPSAITPSGSPFTYQNLDGYEEQVTVGGGTVTLIEIATNGTTFSTTGLTQGVFNLDNTAAIRVTYSVAPTMLKIPVV